MLPFTFLSPAFLIGMLAALIPLIIHLSRSRRVKKMRFSTTRFFTDQFLRSYRMSRLKELLLLACRMALCALFALALARPLYMPKGQSFLMGGTRSIVLVLDNSASMGYTENGQTLLDRARNSARELLDGLGANDTVSVVLAGRRESGPEVLYEKKPTPELGDVLQAINTVPVAALGTDLIGAVSKAEEILHASEASSKEVYVLSDMQKSGLPEPEADTSSQSSSEIAFFFVRFHPQSVANLAVTAVQYDTGRPMVGEPFEIRPKVIAQGAPPQSGDVRLYVDGQKVGERPMTRFLNGPPADRHLEHTFSKPGWHSGYVEIHDETLTLDNRRYFAMEVLDRFPVLAVNGAPSQISRLDELFFLKAALTASAEGKSSIELTTASPAEVAGLDLAKYPVVILANVASLSNAAVEKLEDYVDRGGSLLICLGDKVNAAFYNQHLIAASRPNGGLLPGRLLTIEGKADGPESFATISHVDYDHRALAKFQNPRFATLAGVTFRALWKVEPGEGAAVLMQASTGAPLLCEKTYGKGKVMLFTSTCDRDWTNFPVRPVYLLWTHKLITYLAQQHGRLQEFYVTGDWVPVPYSHMEGMPPAVVDKYDPEKNTFRPLGPAAATDDPDQPLVFKATTQPGIYRLGSPEKKEDSPLVAINLPGYESNLTYLDDVFENPATDVPAHLQKVLNRPLVTYVEDPARVLEVSEAARRGVKLWDVVLAVVLAIALFEPWLANRISMRHYARPKEVTEASAARAGRFGRVAPAPAAPPAVQEVATR
jgi:hypothetical protein